MKNTVLLNENIKVIVPDFQRLYTTIDNVVSRRDFTLMVAYFEQQK